MCSLFLFADAHLHVGLVVQVSCSSVTRTARESHAKSLRARQGIILHSNIIAVAQHDYRFSGGIEQLSIVKRILFNQYIRRSTNVHERAVSVAVEGVVDERQVSECTCRCVRGRILLRQELHIASSLSDTKVVLVEAIVANNNVFSAVTLPPAARVAAHQDGGASGLFNAAVLDQRVPVVHQDAACSVLAHNGVLNHCCGNCLDDDNVVYTTKKLKGQFSISINQQKHVLDVGNRTIKVAVDDGRDSRHGSDSESRVGCEGRVRRGKAEDVPNLNGRDQ